MRLEGNNGSDEDVLTYAMFPQVAPKFFKTRAEGRKNLGKDPSKAAPAPKRRRAAATRQRRRRMRSSAKVNYVITLNGKEHRVTVAPEK